MIWDFRRDEGVDLSHGKDWAGLNRASMVSPTINLTTALLLVVLEHAGDHQQLRMRG